MVVDLGAGMKGGEPVVYLEVAGRKRRLKVLPTSTSKSSDADRYARSLGDFLGVESVMLPSLYGSRPEPYQKDVPSDGWTGGE